MTSASERSQSIVRDISLRPLAFGRLDNPTDMTAGRANEVIRHRCRPLEAVARRLTITTANNVWDVHEHALYHEIIWISVA